MEKFKGIIPTQELGKRSRKQTNRLDDGMEHACHNRWLTEIIIGQVINQKTRTIIFYLVIPLNTPGRASSRKGHGHCLSIPLVRIIDYECSILKDKQNKKAKQRWSSWGRGSTYKHSPPKLLVLTFQSKTMRMCKGLMMTIFWTLCPWFKMWKYIWLGRFRNPKGL